MKYFKLKIIFLQIFLLLTLTALSLVIGKIEFLFTQIVLVLFLILGSWQLFYLINKTNRQLASFLMAWQYKDSSISYPRQENKSFRALNAAMNKSIQQLQLIKEENKEKRAWVREILENLPIGLLLSKSNKEVIYVNPSLLKMLSIPPMKQLSGLDNYHPRLRDKLLEIKSGMEVKISLNTQEDLLAQRVDLNAENEMSLFVIKSFQNQSDEMELEAWQDLMKALSHEMMNSVTVISSLANKMQEREKLTSNEVQEITKRIAKRSKSLLDFSNNYQELIAVKAANKSWFNLRELLEEQHSFLAEELKVIQVQIIGDAKQNIYADRSQMVQVLINLFLNAKNALLTSPEPSIELEYFQERNQCILVFKDNGIGIASEHKNQIFVPFFSTKENGKGIGLSLCRQLMRINQAAISLRGSEVGETSFELRWRME